MSVFWRCTVQETWIIGYWFTFRFNLAHFQVTGRWNRPKLLEDGATNFACSLPNFNYPQLATIRTGKLLRLVSLGLPIDKVIFNYFCMSSLTSVFICKNYYLIWSEHFFLLKIPLSVLHKNLYFCLRQVPATRQEIRQVRFFNDFWMKFEISAWSHCVWQRRWTEGRLLTDIALMMRMLAR